MDEIVNFTFLLNKLHLHTFLFISDLIINTFSSCRVVFPNQCSRYQKCSQNFHQVLPKIPKCLEFPSNCSQELAIKCSQKLVQAIRVLPIFFLICKCSPTSKRLGTTAVETGSEHQMPLCEKQQNNFVKKLQILNADHLFFLYFCPPPTCLGVHR